MSLGKLRKGISYALIEMANTVAVYIQVGVTTRKLPAKRGTSESDIFAASRLIGKKSAIGKLRSGQRC